VTVRRRPVRWINDREPALRAMHDLLVWTLCQGFTDAYAAIYRRGEVEADLYELWSASQAGEGDRLEP
jgi:hypothetical protein